ncbi:hypothetical protein ADK55_19125 [Streptomyces sp. WM4235]|uniref:hypothetical protein n=1 Tax=Streptomyces sp. WM4235 TaxID=1415551 RepID=UPI0006B02573|nr:hypothetical protein [Streptomyces sp. WM4235]KOU48983.1 hypothetical protein ADK55_19125 [Streptomyces sp. WM4235]
MKTKTLPRFNASALALRDNALDPFDADQRTRIPAAAGVAAVTPAVLPVAERIADRITTEVPTLAAKISRDHIANLMDETIREACRPAHLPPLRPGAVRVLVQIAEAKRDQPAEMVEFLDYIAALIWRAGDATGILDEVADLIDSERAATR